MLLGHGAKSKAFIQTLPENSTRQELRRWIVASAS